MGCIHAAFDKQNLLGNTVTKEPWKPFDFVETQQKNENYLLKCTTILYAKAIDECPARTLISWLAWDDRLLLKISYIYIVNSYLQYGGSLITFWKNQIKSNGIKSNRIQCRLMVRVRLVDFTGATLGSAVPRFTLLHSNSNHSVVAFIWISMETLETAPSSVECMFSMQPLLSLGHNFCSEYLVIIVM
jgi:hypothetical protein